MVKTIKFVVEKYLGDPINAIKIFNEKEVDEIVVVDINASKENREPNYSLIEQLACECFMPIGYGGGIKTINQARQIFALGVEKLIIQSAAIDDIDFISNLSSVFGSQSIVISVDIKKTFFGKYKLFQTRESRKSIKDWKVFVQKAVESGAGEILIKSVDLDGTMHGPDLFLINQCSQLVNVPVVFQGGIGSLNDIQACLTAGAAGIAAGAFFVFKGPYRAVLINYPSQAELSQLKVPSNV